MSLALYRPPSFKDADLATQEIVGKKAYREKAREYKNACKANIWRMVYKSRQHEKADDTYDVVALVATPRTIKLDASYKLLISLRGVCGEFFKNGLMHIPFFEQATEKGYVVIAPQYRGNDGGQGKDHYGTDDLYDVIDLFHMAQNHLPHVDRKAQAIMIPKVNPKEIYMFGASRGAMQGLLAVAHGARPRAMVCKATGANFKKYYKEKQQRAVECIEEFCAPNKETEQAIAYVNGDPRYFAAFASLYHKGLEADQEELPRGFGAIKGIYAAGSCLQHSCPEELDKELEKRTVLEYMQQLSEANVPTLFFHGQNDPICPVKEAQEVYDALNVDKKVFIRFAGGHGGNPDERVKMTEQTFAWFEACAK